MGGKRRPSKEERALVDSIAHWERMLDGTGKRESVDGSDCACCHEFLFAGNCEPCERCPISIYVGGLAGCHGTPWAEARIAERSFGRHSKAFKVCANVEINFLKNVLAWVRAGKPERGKKIQQ